MNGLLGALIVTLAADCASADLPRLIDAPAGAVAAHARDRVSHGEFAALAEDLAKALAPLAKEGSAERLASVASRPQVALALAQHAFLAIGTAGLEAIRSEEGGADFTGWLITDRETMEEFLTTGAPPANPSNAIAILHAIWMADRSAEGGHPRRLAVATALEHSVPIRPWSEWDDPAAKTIDPVARYRLYRDAQAKGTLFPGFDALATWELRRVVDLPLYDGDITWFHTSLPANLADGTPLRSQRTIGNAAFLIPYRDTSPTNGKSVQSGKPFYDGKRLTPPVMLEYGGVCGAVSKFGSFAARAFGVPAQPLGQEGHCAFCWKHEENDWRTGNCGSEDDWEVSNLHGLWGSWTARGAAIPVMASLHATPAFLESRRAWQLSRFAESDPRRRLARELELAELCPNGVETFRSIGEWMFAWDEAKPDDLRRFARGVMRGMPAAPQMALDILTRVEGGKAFAAMAAKERARYIEELVEGFVEGAGKAPAFPGGERGLGLAFRETLGRAIWLTIGKVSPLGDWPFLAHLAVLDGTDRTLQDWSTSSKPADRERVADLLVKVASETRRPRLAEQALPRLVELCDGDERLRGRTQTAADRIADGYAKSGDGADVLRVYRSMILAGERLGHRPWIRGFTERALAARGLGTAGPSASSSDSETKTPRTE